MREDIVEINISDILYSFFLGDKQYCVFTDAEDANNDTVSFGLISKIDENNSIITNVPEPDIDKVVAEYEKLMDFFESEDELDSID